jgi:hypothetical protein
MIHACTIYSIRSSQTFLTLIAVLSYTSVVPWCGSFALLYSYPTTLSLPPYGYHFIEAALSFFIIVLSYLL